MRSLCFLLAIGGAAFGALSVEGASRVYTLGSPRPARFRNTNSAAANPWLSANPVFVTTGGYVSSAVEGNSEPHSWQVSFGTNEYRLAYSEVGFSWERSAPQYHLCDRLVPPEDVDWVETYKLFSSDYPDEEASTSGFLFNKSEADPCVYVTKGGNVTFKWVLSGGTVKQVNYTVATAALGRPRRIYWTDYPYNAPPVSLADKFVRFFGDPAVLTVKTGQKTEVSGGQSMSTTNAIVSGLYVEPSSMALKAAGHISGQVIMVYYETGSMDKIVAVQVVEVGEPRIVHAKGVLGVPLRPNGGGYDTKGLTAYVNAGLEEASDGEGPYLYQHKGQYSYSPKNGCVYPLRPTVGCDHKAEVYWMETDELGVQWPFEVDRYECDWMDDFAIQYYVRGDAVGKDGAVDYGASIQFPADYSVTLEKYQEPQGHALAPDGNNSFYTTGPGRCLLRLATSDNIWFLSLKSVLRSDKTIYSLQPSRVTVGQELTLRGGTRSGLVSDRDYFAADDRTPGYVYAAGTTNANYDVNLYSDPFAGNSATNTDTTASSVFAINEGGDVEVWWSELYDRDYSALHGAEILEDMDVLEVLPEPISIPVLPQVFRPVWPARDEAPQIVIASQRGSANEMIWQQHGAAYFDTEDAGLEMPVRDYFPTGSGTLMLWTRAAHYPDAIGETNAPCRLVTLGLDPQRTEGKALRVEIDDQRRLCVRLPGGTDLAAPMPAVREANEWVHVALTFDGSDAVLYTNAAEAARGAVSGEDRSFLSETLYGNWMGVPYDDELAPCDDCVTAVGRELAEVVILNHALSADEIEEARFTVLTGSEGDVTGYHSFRAGEDLGTLIEANGIDVRYFLDRCGRTDCLSFDTAFVAPGAPARGRGVIEADETPVVYLQNDATKPGFNPNEEHAFVNAGSGGYVAWALRCDLNTATSSRPAVMVEYRQDGRNRLQFYHVLLTNETWRTLSAPCTAGELLPGPHPLDLFADPWLAEDHWDGEIIHGPGVGYRDRKKQIWARSAGTLPMRMYYAMQEGFYFPQLPADGQPAVGTAIPWLARVEDPDGDVLAGRPACWMWNVSWPENPKVMKIGQTLTVADGGLPEVWGAKSMAVVYPVASASGIVGDVAADEMPVILTDPTAARSVNFKYDDLAKVGLTTDKNGGLAFKGGKYYFTDLPPSLSSRLYVDATNNRLCFIGERVAKNAGASVLYPNVLSRTEYDLVLNLVPQGRANRELWTDAVERLRSEANVLEPLEPNVHWTKDAEVKTTYRPVDHYALASVCSTGWVTLIENDATEESMSPDADGNHRSSPVNDGDAISMKVLRVTDEYYTGRIVTREDEVNLLSQQLSVIYTEPFGGKPDNFVFEWKSATPRPDGTVPDRYETEYGKRAPRSGESDVGLTRFVVGQQGDTLDSMVNTYWICRYRAADTNSPVGRVMGERWSDWCEPPALAEGWVQRVLNNVTPFNQRMTDLYDNKAETAVSMIQQAGGPYEGDVALNQDNLESVGLIQLYETILNKAESMSIGLHPSGDAANKQLLLAVERLGDLYKVLGDEAYSDAKNPTVGFGSNLATLMDEPAVDFGAEASSLFCFDNQVNSLLDEELCLLRGRSGVSAPTTHTGPYYNRLLWNFTKGITAGEVAYAVNYNVGGTETVALSEEQAARLYPQGHGDAYGHYLSALKGWYRLLRNPNFDWGVPAQGEMNVADSAVNVDYREEAKFAEAAADLAKTAADVVDLSARKAMRDGGKGGSGYLDTNPTNAFGYGEWACRGAYGALINWAVGNSVLPADAARGADGSINAAYADRGLTRIDRGTVDELQDICDAAARVMAVVDGLDKGLNPLGLADNAIPFDIAPAGASDGTSTHFEQVRDRARTALGNARAVLERAQTQSNRLRMIQESAESYAGAIAGEEEDYERELIAIYGRPYSDDVGPGGTYAQGYEGPDLVHYMWMDLSKFGLTSVDDTLSKSCVYYRDIGDYQRGVMRVLSSLTGHLTKDLEALKTDGNVLYERSASGLIVKPDRITGSRPVQGSIQEKYGEFLLQYLKVRRLTAEYDNSIKDLEISQAYVTMLSWLYIAEDAVKQAVRIYKDAKAVSDSVFEKAINSIDYFTYLNEHYLNAQDAVTPGTLGAGMAVISDPSAIVSAATEVSVGTMLTEFESTRLLLKNRRVDTNFLLELLSNAEENISAGLNNKQEVDALVEQIREAANAVNDKYYDLSEAVATLNTCVEAYNAEVGKGEALLSKREQVRKRQVNQLSQFRYNEMLFRKIRDKSLTRYSAAFDLAQKYVFMAAQVYDYETALRRSEDGSGGSFKEKIVATRSLGAFTEDGEPTVADDGDLGLSGYLAQMEANWLVLKPRLGVNNPQPYATWFSLRHELFRILSGEEGDAAWAKELENHYVEDINSDPEFLRYCQPFQSQYGLKAKEPGFVIPFETTVDFGKNLFGNEIAGGDHAYDSSWYSTRIAGAGVWLDGYNRKTADASSRTQAQLSETPVVYLVPVGDDRMRAPGLSDGTFWNYSVVDQVIPAPYAIGSYELDDDAWMPSLSYADWQGQDAAVKIRRHPSFRAYFATENAEEPSDDGLDATRLIGRSVWNTRWLLIIPAGAMNSDREKAISTFVRGCDVDRDGRLDQCPVRDIRIGFRTYSQAGN